jgi:hypothetical protein
MPQPDDAFDAAAASLLIELAFLVPPGTDFRTTIGPKLHAFKQAIERRTLSALPECTCRVIEKCDRCEVIDMALTTPLTPHNSSPDSGLSTATDDPTAQPPADGSPRGA